MRVRAWKLPQQFDIVRTSRCMTHVLNPLTVIQSSLRFIRLTWWVATGKRLKEHMSQAVWQCWLSMLCCEWFREQLQLFQKDHSKYHLLLRNFWWFCSVLFWFSVLGFELGFALARQMLYLLSCVPCPFVLATFQIRVSHFWLGWLEPQSHHRHIPPFPT
jgi:hypothetical protein